MQRSHALRIAVVALASFSAVAVVHVPGQAATAVVCQSGQLQPGPVRRVSPAASWAGWPSLVANATGRLTTVFGVQQTTPQGDDQFLWSGDVPQSPQDPQLIRGGDSMRWPAMGSDPDFVRDLGIDGAGTQTFAFMEDSTRGDTWSVRVVTRPAGGQWSLPTRISSVSGFLTHVQLAVNPSGAAVVTWNPSIDELFAAYRPSANAAWLPAERVAKHGYDHQTGIDDDGSVTVVYRGIDGTYVRTRRFEPATGWTPVRALSKTANAYAPNLAVSPNGALVTTWEDKVPGSSRYRHFAKRMTAAEVWLPTVRRQGGPVYPGGLAIDGRGVATVAWWSPHDEVMTQVGRHDGSWGPPTLLSGPQHDPDRFALQITMNRIGDTFVVWKARPSVGPLLRGTYRPAGQAWAPILRLTPTGTNADIYTSTTAPNGDAGVAWSRSSRVETRRLVPCA